jgi:hypothetical protein
MPQKKKVTLPAEGEAFAVPLEDGRYSVCRVIHGAGSDAARQWSKSPCVLVACSAWIGSELPRAYDAALRPILRLTHHSWTGQPEMAWVSDAAPSELIPIGTIPPTADEKAMECNASGGWASFAIQPLKQWQWDHEHSAVLADDENERRKAIEQHNQRAEEQEAFLAATTLDDLRDHQFFPRWDEFLPAMVVSESRKLMAATVRQLAELGTSAPEHERMAVLQECIESFNRLDATFRFIETLEREDICEEFEALVHACGLGHYEDLADEWREW